MRNHRGMNADGGTRDAGHDLEILRRLSDGSDHAPDKWTMSLSVYPRMVVVGDSDEAESHLLCSTGVPDQVRRPMFFTRDLVAKLQVHPSQGLRMSGSAIVASAEAPAANRSICTNPRRRPAGSMMWREFGSARRMGNHDRHKGLSR